MSSQFALLKARRYGPFFGTQFLGAFNDNLYKNALLVLLTFHATQWTTLEPAVLANLAAGIFILPFFLFSASAGNWRINTTKPRWRGWSKSSKSSSCSLRESVSGCIA